MPGLLTEKWKCKQIVLVTERRELSMIKLSLWLTYSTYSKTGERRKKRTKEMNVYQLHNRHAFPYIVGNFTFLSVEKFIVFCLRDGYVMVRIFYKNIFVGRLRACCMTACICPTPLHCLPRTCPNTATEIGSVDGAISWLSRSSRNLKAASTYQIPTRSRIPLISSHLPSSWTVS